MKKRRVLKSWVRKILMGVCGGYVLMCGTTIEMVGNTTYNWILFIWTICYFASLIILEKF